MVDGSDDIGKGIFSPMFDQGALDEAEHGAAAADQAMWEKRSNPILNTRIRTRELLAEAQEQEERMRERQEMLLVARFLDELPETIDFLRATARRRGAGVRHRLRRKLDGAVDAVERRAVRIITMAAQEVYRERMEQVELVTRLGRKRPQRGSDPVRTPGIDIGDDPENRPTPESNAVNDVFHRMAAKVDGLLNPIRRWLSRVGPSERDDQV